MEELKAKFLRWCHWVWWVIRPWRWSDESHCSIDILDDPAQFKNPDNAAKLFGCTCGKVFYRNGPESQYQFDEWMRRLKTRQGKRWRQ